jgi:choline dehydrogenase
MQIFVWTDGSTLDVALLAQHNIPLVRHAPAVGKNLQDHLCVSFYFKANKKTLNDDLGSLFGQVKAGIQYLFKRSGPLAMSVNQAGGILQGKRAGKTSESAVIFQSAFLPDTEKPEGQAKA